MAGSRFCENCGAELHEGAQFCGKCGHTVSASAPTAEPPTAAPVGVASGGTGELPGWLIPTLIGAVVVALIASGVALVAGGGDDTTAKKSGGTEIGQGEVLLEPINTQVPNQFAPRATATSATEPTVQPNVLPAGVPANAGSGGQVSGDAPGLYGGSGNLAVCNREQLIAFLESHPGQARAFAGVLGITPAQIRDYVMSLTPVVLTTDTLVLNHGYSNGRATPRNAVLQAGTAVLIDKYGVPRVKCGCGNPLAPPTVTKAVRIRGPRWPGFRPTNVTQVISSTTVINVVVIVNINDGTLINRPVGTDGTQDTSVLIDQQCDLFPNDPTCATTTTSSTLAPSTPPSQSPPPTAYPDYCNFDPNQDGCAGYVPPDGTLPPDYTPNVCDPNDPYYCPDCPECAVG